MTNHPKSWTFAGGAWHEGDTPLFGSMTHAAWLGSVVFDGARAFEGVTPDLDRHCARTVESAAALGLSSPVAGGEMLEIAQDGLAHFGSDEALYSRPMVWAEEGGMFMIPPEPESCKFAMTLWSAPMTAVESFSLTTTRFRRPTLDCATTNAKASCLYPNNARMLMEARQKGFDNALVCDVMGNVAELATANVFLAKDGVVATPVPNGCFLNGITRQRVMALLRAAGHDVREAVLTLDDFREADEVFSTGNFLKVTSITRFDDVEYGVGPIATEARKLYWDWAHG